MKKIIALLVVCGFAIALVSCGKKVEEAAATTDTVATETVVADTMATDTVVADTTAAE